MAAYTGERWRQARAKALSRDNNRCQDCGSPDNLHAHHIKPVRTFDNPSDAHYVENLVTLCKYCHRSWEGRQARPVLLDAEHQTQLSSIVSYATVPDLLHELLREAATDVFTTHIWKNQSICSWCFSRMGPTRSSPMSNWVDLLSRATLGQEPMPDEPMSLDTRSSPLSCPECGYAGGKVQLRKKYQLVGHIRSVYDRLEEFRIPADKPVMEHVVRHRKSQVSLQGDDIEHLRKATACGIVSELHDSGGENFILDEKLPPVSTTN